MDDTEATDFAHKNIIRQIDDEDWASVEEGLIDRRAVVKIISKRHYAAGLCSVFDCYENLEVSHDNKLYRACAKHRLDSSIHMTAVDNGYCPFCNSEITEVSRDRRAVIFDCQNEYYVHGEHVKRLSLEIY